MRSARVQRALWEFSKGNPLRNSLSGDLSMSAVCRGISQANGHASLFFVRIFARAYAFIRDNPLVTDLNDSFLICELSRCKKKKQPLAKYALVRYKRGTLAETRRGPSRGFYETATLESPGGLLESENRPCHLSYMRRAVDWGRNHK